MSEFKGTQTEKNLMAAFQGESMARNRYTFFSEQARSAGDLETAELFERMAKNEMFHAKMLFKLLNGGFGEPAANLQSAAAGENQEWQSMYPSFAREARAEGFEQVAKLFEQVAEIEKSHEKSFLKAFVNRVTSEKPDEPEPVPTAPKTVYRCQFCGVTFEHRPDVCDVCGAIGSFDPVRE